MLCVLIKGPSFEEADQQILQALPYADLVELRLDSFHSIDSAPLKTLLEKHSIPMIFTLRGGREIDLKRLAELQPAYFDIEDHLTVEPFSDTKIICSHHDFEKVPDLPLLYNEMRKKKAFFYKIAVTPQSTCEALSLLSFAKASCDHLIVIGMGKYGQVSRILGPVIGNPITYASLEDDPDHPLGQLSAEILVNRYHHRSLNKKTALYGLMGDPVTRSMSDKTHNRFFQDHHLDAVYVKMRVEPNQLEECLQLASHHFCGLSVTMPLKESVVPFLDECDPEALKIGAVNTLVFQEGRIKGFNTDGKGALDALEKRGKVDGKHIVILGAGGAAKAIAYEAYKRGAHLTILNRNVERASQLAALVQGASASLDEISEISYDCVINCTSSEMPISHLLPGAIVMDILTRGFEKTPFLEEAEKRGCLVVHGYEMFLGQAQEQFKLWNLCH